MFFPSFFGHWCLNWNDMVRFDNMLFSGGNYGIKGRRFTNQFYVRPLFLYPVLVTDISAMVEPIGVKFCMTIRGVHYKQNTLHFWAFLQYLLWQTPDHSCVVERHLCIARRRSTQSAAYQAPAVMDQTFVDTTPPALLPSLDDIVHIVLTAPCTAYGEIWVLLTHLFKFSLLQPG